MSASMALGDVPGVESQRDLDAAVLDASRPAPLRLNAAYQLSRSIQRFGPLVSADQEKRLAEALDQEDDAAMKTALASIVGSLRPKPEAVGRRLQAARAVPPEPVPPPAPR